MPQHLAFCLVLSGIVVTLTACGGSKSVEDYLSRAQQEMKAGGYIAAEIEVKNALKLDPENPASRQLLATVYVKKGDYISAKDEFSKALERGARPDDIYPDLSEVLFRVRDFDSLQALEVGELEKEANRAELMAKQGRACLAKGDKICGGALIEAAHELADDAQAVIVAQAEILSFQFEEDLAIRRLNDLLEADQSYVPAWILKGDVHFRTQDLEMSETAYSSAIEYDSYRIDILQKRAQLRLRMKNYEGAQADVDLLKRSVPDNNNVQFIQGMLLMQASRPQAAKESFSKVLNANPENTQVLYQLCLANFLTGDLEQARASGEQLINLTPDSVAGRKLLSRVYQGLGRLDEAESVIRPVVEQNGADMEANSLLAEILLRNGETAESATLFSEIVKLQPDSAKAHLGLGLALLRNEQPDSGEEHISEALVLDPSLQPAHEALITLFVDQRRYPNAKNALEGYINHFPEDASAHNFVGITQLRMGETEAAETAFNKALAIEPTYRAAHYNLASISIGRKDYSRAREILNEVLTSHTDDLTALLRMIKLDALERKPGLMLKHMERASAAHPTELEPQLILGRHYLITGQADKVTGLFTQLDVNERRSPDALDLTGKAELALGNHENALFVFKQLAKTSPESAEAHFLSAQAYAGMGNAEGMKEELERTIELNPDHFTARYALASSQAEEGNIKEAEKALSKLRTMDPDNPTLLLLETRIAASQGNMERVESSLQEIFDTAPSSRNVIALASAQWNAGDRDGALELQRQWLADHPDDVPVTMTMAASLQKMGQAEEAIALYEKVLANNENSVIVLNDLAWALRDIDTDKALEYAERAIVLAPELPAILDTKAVLLYKKDQLLLARRTMDKALQQQPGNPTFRYHSAMINAAMGEREAATKELSDLVAEDIEFREKLEAEELLQSLQN